MIVSRKQIEELFLDGGVGTWPLLGDKGYAPMTVDWLKGEFSYAFRGHLFKYGRTKWRYENWDCDKFARAAAHIADLCHAGTPDAPVAGLAFGEFWYQDKTIGAHAINVAVTKDTRGLRLVFFEPQNAAKGSNPIVQLTREEIQSCVMYRF